MGDILKIKYKMFSIAIPYCDIIYWYIWYVNLSLIVDSLWVNIVRK